MGFASAIPLIATAIGAGLSLAGTAKSRSAMDDAQMAELTRQKKYSGESQAAYQRSAEQSTPEAAKSQMDAGSKSAAETYAKVAQLPMGGANAASQVPTSAAVQEGTNMQNAQRNAAASKLQGHNTFSLAQSLKDLQARDQLGMTSSLSQSSANVMPYEIQAGQHAGDSLGAAGSLLGTAGSLYGTYQALKPYVSTPMSVGAASVARPVYGTDPNLGLWGSSAYGLMQNPGPYQWPNRVQFGG